MLQSFHLFLRTVSLGQHAVIAHNIHHKQRLNWLGRRRCTAVTVRTRGRSHPYCAATAQPTDRRPPPHLHHPCSVEMRSSRTIPTTNCRRADRRADVGVELLREAKEGGTGPNSHRIALRPLPHPAPAPPWPLPKQPAAGPAPSSEGRARVSARV